MSILNLIAGIFKPAADLVDSLHDSKEEMGNIAVKKAELRNQLSQIEAQVSTKLIGLQSEVIAANSKIAIAEQEHGNLLSKSWRPITSLAFVSLLIAMGMGFVEFNQFLAGIAGSFLGIYAPMRSLIDKKK